jgi:hypothetical protein
MSVSETSEAIFASLSRHGSLQRLRSRIRAEIFNNISDGGIIAPEKSREVYLSAELIRDFLRTLNLHATLDVFNEEIGVMIDEENTTSNREFLAGELGFDIISEDTSDKIPMLTLLTNWMLSNKKKLQR